PESEQKNIFERFNRSWAEGKYQYEGSGIGLALTKDLVEVLGGTISVKSKPDEGAAFTVCIPLTKDSESFSETEPAVTVGHAAEVSPDDKIEDLTNDSDAVILIVEDNSDVRAYIASCLDGK